MARRRRQSDAILTKADKARLKRYAKVVGVQGKKIGKKAFVQGFKLKEFLKQKLRKKIY